MTHQDTKDALRKCKNMMQIEDALQRTYCRNDADKADYLYVMFDLPKRTDYRSAARMVIEMNKAS